MKTLARCLACLALAGCTIVTTDAGAFASHDDLEPGAGRVNVFNFVIQGSTEEADEIIASVGSAAGETLVPGSR